MNAKRRLPAVLQSLADDFVGALVAMPPIEPDSETGRVTDRVVLPQRVGPLSTTFAGPGHFRFTSGPGRTDWPSLWATTSWGAADPRDDSGRLVEFNLAIPLVTSEQAPACTIWLSAADNDRGVPVYRGWTPRLEQLQGWLQTEAVDRWLNDFVPYDLVRRRGWLALSNELQRAFRNNDISMDALGVTTQPGDIEPDGETSAIVRLDLPDYGTVEATIGLPQPNEHGTMPGEFTFRSGDLEVEVNPPRLDRPESGPPAEGWWAMAKWRSGFDDGVEVVAVSYDDPGEMLGSPSEMTSWLRACPLVPTVASETLDHVIRAYDGPSTWDPDANKWVWGQRT
jgi:hypothetical protein